MDFDAWMAQVDGKLLQMIGVCSSDLPDQMYWDAWNEGVTPHEQALDVLESEGYPL